MTLGYWFCAAVLALPALGQQPAFEAASVKPAAQVEGLIETIRQSTPGRVTYRNYSLKRLLTEAYQVSRYQVEGPAWIERDRYDIVATKPRGTTADQERQMVQNLVAARFHVVQHSEKREMAAYALLSGKDTSRLHVVKESGDAEGCDHSGTMAQYAELLSARIDKPVVDRTGIPGRYYFILVYSDQPQLRTDSGVPPPPPPPPPPPSGAGCPGWTGKWPSIEYNVFDAVKEQMGLRLERTGTTAVSVIVLDHVEKATAN
jgi:uncharacterized protein (TIGR03435 family)